MRKYLDIGKRLIILRGNKTQITFSKEIGVKLRTYQNYEAGERVPHPHSLTKIAEMCDTTVDWILTGELNIKKARAIEHLKRAYTAEELVEKLEESIKREERLLWAGVKEQAPEYGLERLEEKDFIENLRGYIADIKIDFLPTEKRKLVEAVIEILDSKHEKVIKALVANIEAFLEMVRILKKKNEDKGGD